MVPRVALLLMLPLLGVPLSAEVKDLKGYFVQHCAVCHGTDGSGRGPSGARLGGRNLADGRWLAGQEEAALVAAILRGKGAMPGFRRQLSEPEARRLLTSVVQRLATRRKL